MFFRLMKHQTYLCVDLRTRTQDSFLTVGEGKTGMLTMTEDGEKFEFDEILPIKERRNAKLWSGHRLNVKKNIFGDVLVHFRRLEMNKKLNPTMVAKEIKYELQMAMKALGL